MNKYESVIGLEVHVETNTKTKMFCACSADYFGKEPNTHTCPVCLGLPGALPYTNKEAIEKCIKIGLALGCQISSESLFERKNYFYPDLAKGYQISQYRWPLCVNGSIQVTNSQGKKTTIRINRAHQEEDTGKLTHSGGESLIDFNRSGVPLVEIVTEPDFRDLEEIRDYAKKLQSIVKNLGVSNADMERGDMRLEANVSVRKIGQQKLPPYRVELKNINSFRFMVAATKYEIERQIKALESGEELHQETRGWNEEKRETYLQRSKEEANDYRYFPEPDLPKLELARSYIISLDKDQPETPHLKLSRFMADYLLNEYDAEILIRSNAIAEYFEAAVRIGSAKDIAPKQIANVIINQKPDMSKLSPDDLIKSLVSKGQISSISDQDLEQIIKEVLKENGKAVADFKSGNPNAIQMLIGMVMKKTSGQANPKKAQKILSDLLQ